MTDQFEQLKALVDEITNSPEQALVIEIDSVRWSFRMFQGNYYDLVKPLEILEEKPEAIKLWDIKNKQNLHRTFEEIGRLFHNFLASSMSLVDHTRRHVEKLYSNSPHASFLQDYKDEVSSRFAENANHQIAQGLRNYIQHRNLPFVGSLISYTREAGLKRAFIVSSIHLLEWNGWKPKARAKIAEMKDGLHIRKFATEYHDDVQSFAKWLWNKQMEIHKDDMDRLKKLKEQARFAFRQAGLGDLVKQ
jgi:hypothetical protein